MLFEQAFFHLPEILTGSGYPRQRYEGGIVSAFSLALLQTLNGRNVSNPISCLHAERPFRGIKSWPRGASNKPRYLRADLHLNLRDMKVGSDRLSAYGWRHYNWLEAKFFRGSATNGQQNTTHLLEDLLRLFALVPNVLTNKKKKKGVTTAKMMTGRYLLHVYETFDPDHYVSRRRQIGGGTEERKWLSPLMTGGPGACSRIKLSDSESDGILKQINPKLGELEIEFEATSWRLGPTYDLGKNTRQYVCLLSRIDSFTISRGVETLSIGKDRSYSASAKFQTEIREFVGTWINIKSDVENEQPDAAETSDEAETEAITDMD